MSNTYTNRPCATRNRGRGTVRGRGNKNRSSNLTEQMQQSPSGRGRGQAVDRRSGAIGNKQEDGELEHSNGNASSDNQMDRMQRRDAYTMISPNEKKRQSIAEKAKKEEEAYNKYKEEKKVGYVSYVGTAGGGEVSQQTARQRTVNQQKQAPFNAKMKSQQYRENEKQRETGQLNKMKAEQRKKSELNKECDSKRQQNLKDEHRSKNQAFLDRIEQQNRQHRTQKVLSSTAASNYTPAEPPSMSSNNNNVLPSTHSEPQTHPNSDIDNELSGTASTALNMQNPMDILRIEFPTHDSGFLEDLLFQFNGNIDQVRDMLT